MIPRIWERASFRSRFEDGIYDGEVNPPPRRLTWRRAQALALTVILMALVGCGGPAGSLDDIRSTGVLRVAIDPSFPPFEAVDGNGQIVGLDADLAREIARRMGVEAHLVTTGYDALYDALTVNQADVIISALYPDPARSAGFEFSHPYFDAGQVLVTAEGSDISAPTDLAGRSVACVFGTEGHMQALRWELSLDPPPTILTVDDWTAAVTYLREGRADAVVIDRVSAQIAINTEGGLAMVGPPVVAEPYVIAARHEDADLIDAINGILQDMETDGELEALVDSWMRP